jgi:hypothetical protein
MQTGAGSRLDSARLGTGSDIGSARLRIGSGLSSAPARTWLGHGLGHWPWPDFIQAFHRAVGMRIFKRDFPIRYLTKIAEFYVHAKVFKCSIQWCA